MAAAADVERQLDRVLQRAARMTGHVVGHEVLVGSGLLIGLFVGLDEAVVHLDRRLAHRAQHARRDVLGRDLQLAADMMAHQLIEECGAFVGQQIVKAYAGAYEHLLYARQRAQLAQERYVVAVVGHEVAAGRGEETLAVLARAALELAVAGGAAEVGRGAAHVVDIALEVGQLRELFRLGDHRFMAARRDDAPLMEGQRAERARAVAAAHMGDGKLDFLERGDAAQAVVHRVPRAHIGQGVGVVQLLLSQRHGWRVGDQIARAVFLADAAPAHGILLVVLNLERARIGLFVGGDLFGRFDRDVGRLDLAGHHARSGNAHGVEGHAVFQRAHRFQYDALAHAVHQHVRARIDED